MLLLAMCIFMLHSYIPDTRGATMAKKLRGPSFGSQHWGTRTPCPAKTGLGFGCGRGWSGGITPWKFLKT